MHVARISVPFLRPPKTQDLASIKSSLGSTKTHRQTKNPIIIQDSTKQTPSRDEKLVPVYPSVPKPLLCLTCCSTCSTYKRASPAQGWSAVPKQNGANIRCDVERCPGSADSESVVQMAENGWVGTQLPTGLRWLWPMAGCPLGSWNLIEGFLYPTYQPANQFEAVWTSNKSMGNVWDASPVGFIFIPCLAHF